MTCLAAAVCAVFPGSASAVNYTAFTLGTGPYSFALAYGITGGQYVGYSFETNFHAILWSNSSSTPIDLNPTNISGITSSMAYVTTGTQQVGSISGTGTGNNSHAARWSNAANTAVDLNPTNLSGLTASEAFGISGLQEVGYGTGAATTGNKHALLWNNTANSAVDLNPTNLTGFTTSLAYNTTGTIQVGYGSGPATGNAQHALLWTGAANTAVDLNPTNLTGVALSVARAASGTQQVGWAAIGSNGGSNHAMLWTGAANTAVDLNPGQIGGTFYGASIAANTNGTQQVGYAVDQSGFPRAMIWSGTAASVVNLDALLSGHQGGTEAESIDPYGNVSGFTYPTNPQPVVWLAGDVYRLNGTGAWGTTGNWTSSTPAAGTDTMLISADGASRSVTFSAATTSVSLGTLTVDATNSGSMTLVQQANRLSAASESIGFVGSGTFNQTGGRNQIVGTLTLGAKSGSTGSYLLSGASTLVAGSIQINTGTFNQSGGTLTTGTLVNNGSFTGAAALLGAVTGTGSLTLIGASTASSITQNSLNVTGSLLLTGSAANSIPAVTNSGTIQQNSGTVAATTVINNGSFTASRGSLGSVSGTGSLTVSLNATATSIVQNDLAVTGTLSISANGGNSAVTVINSLAIGSSGKLDLNDNDMIVSYSGASPAVMIRSLLVTGYNAGAWTGLGIRSSTAAGNPLTALGYGEASDLGYTSFGGQPTGANAVLVKYTYYGDSSLDGKVDLGNDFNLFLQGFMATNASAWELGDYNYDGKVDMSDFTLFLDGYAGQGGSLGSLEQFVEGTDELSVAQKASVLSIIPEPSSIVLLSVLAGTCATRRRRRV